MNQEKIRIDKYLWAIRLFKSRTLAANACEHSLVKFQHKAVKASKQVLVGEVYAIKTEARKWIIQVTKVIEARVAYSVAITCYIDLTPEEDKIATTSSESQVFYTGKRQSKQGRPTKKKRRELGQFGEEE